MREYTADIMNAAAQACRDADYSPSNFDGSPSAVCRAIANAIATERERCAALADGMYGEGKSRPYDDGCTEIGWDDATQAISDAIRTPPKPSSEPTP